MTNLSCVAVLEVMFLSDLLMLTFCALVAMIAVKKEKNNLLTHCILDRSTYSQDEAGKALQGTWVCGCVYSFQKFWMR